MVTSHGCMPADQTAADISLSPLLPSSLPRSSRFVKQSFLCSDMCNGNICRVMGSDINAGCVKGHMNRTMHVSA